MTSQAKSSNPSSPSPPSIYDELGLEPTASDEEINTQFELVMAAISSLPEDQRVAKVERLQEQIKPLKSCRHRVQVNALILDRIDVRTIQSRLNNLPDLQSENVMLPPPSLAQVLIEGTSNELTDLDFPESEEDPELQIAVTEIAELQRHRKPRHIVFDN